MMLIAFGIGVAGYSAAQKYWMSAMQARLDDIASSPKDWLPPSNPDPYRFNWTLPPPRMGVVVPATRP
jgi:hypothetical protein